MPSKMAATIPKAARITRKLKRASMGIVPPQNERTRTAAGSLSINLTDYSELPAAAAESIVHCAHALAGASEHEV